MRAMRIIAKRNQKYEKIKNFFSRFG